jgi:hypothetical protein
MYGGVEYFSNFASIRLFHLSPMSTFRKHIPLLVSLILIPFLNLAQATKFGTITADAGIGGGLSFEYGYSPANQSDHYGLKYPGSLPSLDADFSINKLLSVGVRYRRGTYGKSTISIARGTDFLGCLNFHVANKNERFDLVVGAGYGYGSLMSDRYLVGHLHCTGGLINVHISPHIYFNKYLGMFASLGYNHYLFNQINLEDTNGVVYTQADGATWHLTGLYVELGIAVRLQVVTRD